MRILVVEDEKDLNNIITKHLKKNNFSVDSVFNGEEALEYLDYGTYDLIVLDIMLPKVNGYEVIKKLRENKNETAVLMLTARDSIEDKIKGLDLGADDYLIKPFDFGEFLARIRALIRRKYGNRNAKRFVINHTNQNVWIPNKHLKEDGTIKITENIDYVFRRSIRQLELAGITQPIIGIKKKNNKIRKEENKWIKY